MGLKMCYFRINTSQRVSQTLKFNRLCKTTKEKKILEFGVQIHPIISHTLFSSIVFL